MVSFYSIVLFRNQYKMSKSKIVKANGATPDEFELSVAQEFANLEVS